MVALAIATVIRRFAPCFLVLAALLAFVPRPAAGFAKAKEQCLYELTDENYKGLLKCSHSTPSFSFPVARWLILVYTAWSTPCDKIKPVWSLMASMMCNDTRVMFGQFNGYSGILGHNV